MRITDRIQSFVKEYWSPLLLTGALIGFSVWLQLAYEWSAMWLDEETWQGMLNLHLTWNPFAVRFFQSYSTLALHQVFGIPVRESFFTVQFTLEMILGVTMYRYLCRLGFDRGWALVGVALTFTAYPIMGANFEPTHTWDDFWLYLFLVLTLLAALNRRPIAAAIYLTLAFFAREQAVLFYPLVLLILWWQRDEVRLPRMILPALLPPTAYGLFRVYKWEPIDPYRWQLFNDNFQNPGTTQDSIVSILVCFGALWLLALLGLRATSQMKDVTSRRLLRWGMATAVPLTTAVALLFTFVRETRILFPSFVIIVPLSLLFAQATWKGTTHFRLSWLIGLLILTGLAVWACIPWAHRLFPLFAYGANAMFRRSLLGVHLGIALVCVVGLLIAGISRRISRRREMS